MGPKQNILEKFSNWWSIFVTFNQANRNEFMVLDRKYQNFMKPSSLTGKNKEAQQQLSK